MKPLNLLLALLLLPRLLWADTVPFVSSGDAEIDAVRKEINVQPTDESNYAKRLLLMKLWAVALQQQGVYLGAEYEQVDLELRRVSKWNPVFQGLEGQVYTAADIKKIGEIAGRGYQILEELQRQFSENPESVGYAHQQGEERLTFTDAPTDLPWADYRGNAQRTGFSGADGPVKGKLAWRAPVSIRWTSSPAFDGDTLYLVSPGMRNMLWKMDVNTGNVYEVFKHTPKLQGDQLYSAPAMASQPAIVGDHIFLRQMGSRGNRGATKYIVKYNRYSGKEVDRFLVGHVDYRMGSAPLAVNENFLVYSYAMHDIEGRPPLCEPFNRVICRNPKTGKKLWDFNIGPFFSDPVLDNNRIFVGNATGQFYCLKADQWYRPASEERIAWEFQADGELNQNPLVTDKVVYFSSNTGWLYAVDRQTGKLNWKSKLERATGHFSKLFSAPVLIPDHEALVLSSAQKHLFVLNGETGDLLAKAELEQGSYAGIGVEGNDLVTVDFSGKAYGFEWTGKKLVTKWKKQVGEHEVFSQVKIKNGKAIYTDGHLMAYALDVRNGKKLWEHSIINAFKKDGQYIGTDQIAGGAYYESKPTANNGKIYIGSPARFVQAVDAQSGKILWRFETTGAISGAPVINDGKIYIGQEGGDDRFYCLNAETGQQLWTQSIGWVWGSANVANQRVFVPGVDGYVNCLSADNGAILWRYRTERSTCTEPLILGNDVYFGGWDHYMYKFDQATGKLKWKFQLGGGSDSGAPIAGDGKLFLPVGGGTFRALNPETKKVEWIPSLQGKMYNVTPGYHDGKVYLSCLNGQGIGGIPINNQIFCADAKTGEIEWTFDGGGGLTGPVIGNNNRLYFASTASPYFYCVKPKGNGDGTTDILWKVKMENKVEESVPILYKRKAYVLNSAGYLVAIE